MEEICLKCILDLYEKAMTNLAEALRLAKEFEVRLALNKLDKIAVCVEQNEELLPLIKSKYISIHFPDNLTPKEQLGFFVDKTSIPHYIEAVAFTNQIISAEINARLKPSKPPEIMYA